MTVKKLVLLMTSALLLAGCSTTPIAPVADLTPSVYPLAGALDASTAADWSWRSVLVDPRLRRLVDLSLDHSRDLRIAVLDAEAAQAQLRAQNASFWPQISGELTSTRGRFANMGMAPGAGGAPMIEQAVGGARLTAFELDLFGRLRAQSQSAFASYLASEEGVSAARIALTATVAQAYVAELAAQEQVDLIQQTLDDWRQSQTLTERRMDAGQASLEDVAQAQAQVLTAEADLQGATRTLAVAHNALQRVIGTALPADLPPAGALAAGPVVTALPAGTPSDLLTRRPDIRAAEFRLQAARADVKAARAAFFPSINLTGQLGYASGDLDDLFGGGAARQWMFTPAVTIPIFQGGRLKAQFDLSKIRTDSAVAAYERSIQQAFAEVADGLAGRETFGRQIQAQAQAEAKTRQRVRLADARYRAGVASRLELLDAQREHYAAQRSLIDLRQAELTAGVDLFRALGGGMDVRTPQLASAAR